MIITIIWVGKTDEAYLREGIDKYLGRLKHYERLEISEVREAKKLKSANDVLQYECKEILAKINPNDYLILLDEKGRQYDSVEFANKLEEKRLRSIKNLTFVIGGAYGFTEEVYQRAQEQISLSRMTFSHQMIRLFFLEQLYRGYTILRNEKYHNP